MASYLFADTGSLAGLARAGLLPTLLPSNNGGRQLVITQEVFQELQSLGGPSAPLAVQWIQSQRVAGNLRLLDDTVVSNPTGTNAGERAIAAYLAGDAPSSSNGGFTIPAGSNSLVVSEDPAA